jgi:peroxiredoxin
VRISALLAIVLLSSCSPVADHTRSAGATEAPAPTADAPVASGAVPFEEAAARANPVEDPGLRVGDLAPDFTLLDQSSREVSLASLVEDGPVALVFTRSLDWCLYCKMQAVQLEQNLATIGASGGRIVGISYDSVSALNRFSAGSRITYPLLSDPGSKTIDAYRIRSANERLPEGVAYHATFIVDRDRVIRAKLFQVSYAEKSALEKLVRALEAAR